MECYHWKLHLFLVLAHLAFAIIFMQRLNLSVALVAMVRSENQLNITKERDEQNTSRAKESAWDEAHQGMILSAFFYGSLLSSVPAGVLVGKCGGKIVAGAGLLTSSSFSILTPVAASNSFFALIMVRMCIGLSQGVLYPAMLSLLRKWSPTGGKNRMIAMATAGTETGAVIAFFVGGILCASKVLGGWPSVFYIFGAVGIVWFIAWTALVAETPQYHLLPADESEETQSHQPLTEEKVEKNVVPWIKILTSIPFLALLAGFFCHGWIWFFIITDLPLYYKKVWNLSVMEGGLFSSLPIICALFTHTVSGYLSDYLRQWWHVKTTKRFIASTGFFATALLLILVSYTKDGENVQAIIYMILCAGASRWNRVTFLSNIIDLSPTYTGVLMGIAGTIATIAGIGAPLVTGFFTNHDPSRENYRVVFFINAGVCVFGGLFFFLFVSGDIQEWDPTSTNKEIDTE